MSRTGKKPVAIPDGITVTVVDGRVNAKGPKGALSVHLPASVSVRVDGAAILVDRKDESRLARGCHGTVRSLLANMVEGVAKGFVRELEIEGVGFRATVQGQSVSLALGFPNPVVYTVPEGITVKEESGTRIVVSGADRQQVGDVAARIRGFFPAEPYKGKGIRYKGERVRRKEGKTVA